MKILYGVQGTGNGHITRARALNQYFREYGLDVDFLFSGRERSRYFDMQEFGDWRCCQGLTFAYRAGGIKILKTLTNNNFRQLHSDIHSLDLNDYDLVLTDFEPISARAAKNQSVPCIGVGHQYAFLHDVPTAGDSLISRNILRHFAPAQYHLGLHWHHFNTPILPPIAEVSSERDSTEAEKIVVYLGFEDPEDVIQYLEPFKDHLFVVYGPYPHYQSLGHIQLKPLSREGFCRDLATCNGVISNAGFELASETIQLGKKLLVKPLQGQMEQLSNAKALVDLGLGMSMSSLDSQQLQRWLSSFHGKRIVYPNVAEAIVQWIHAGRWNDIESLSQKLWSETEFYENGQIEPQRFAPAA